MITDEMATLVEFIINDRLTVTTFDGYYEVDNAGEIARAALTAVLPMIRAEVLEEAAKVADYGVQRAYRDFHDRKIAEGAKEMAAELAATFRALKGREG
jgi:hypothetical protein